MKYSVILYKKNEKKQQLTYLNNYTSFDSAFDYLNSLNLDFLETRKDDSSFWGIDKDGMIVRIERYE